MFRRRNDTLEVLLVHPGGPLYRKKDDDVWTIPKGEADTGEDLLKRARTEFEEEVGIAATGDWIGQAERRQNCSCLGLRGKFAGRFPGLLEHFRNDVAPALGKGAKFSRSRPSLLFFA